MDAQLRSLRLIYGDMLAAAVICALLPEVVSRPNRANINPILYFAFVILAGSMIGLIVMVRRAMIDRALEILQIRPDDALAISRWRIGNILLFALAETLVAYGFFLRFVGATLKQVVPFYAAGIILLLVLQPRKPS
jgi:hypothetical protein